MTDWNDTMKEMYPNWKQLRRRERVHSFWVVVGTVFGLAAVFAVVFLLMKGFGLLGYMAITLICVLLFALWYNSKNHTPES